MNNPARLLATRRLRIAFDARALWAQTTQKTAFLTTPEALRVPAQEVFTQFWSRDNGFPAPNNVGLTGGLKFAVVPWPEQSRVREPRGGG